MNTVIGAVSSIGHNIATGASTMLSMVPHFADGGIVTGPTLALIGESGPEAIVPLSGSRGGGSLGGFGGVVININGGYYLDQQASRLFADMIAKTVGQQLKLRSI